MQASRNSTLSVLYTVVVSSIVVNAPTVFAGEDATRPNIIFIMADDMGMGDTSAYQGQTGNADDVQLHTPQMERLARMGIRFTDAHTPASRCSLTRYGLMTGRYSWRNRLKYWVLFGAQGDPMIEADRPTIATVLRDADYHTGMFGKWHVGLRYRRADGKPAAGFQDADFTRPMHTTPLDHGFETAWFTSRSHATSGPDLNAKPKNKKSANGPNNNRGPGHINGRKIMGATGNGRELVSEGVHAYVLSELGELHSDRAMHFLNRCVVNNDMNKKPFFLYYPFNANHAPYTPAKSIDGVPVAGEARTKSGKAMDARHDFIYENDVALGRILDWLESTEDPRNKRNKLIHNTLIIFTSDNGAEIKSKVATGPFRSNKGSVYEGGHRVPFIAAWPAGGVFPDTTSDVPICLTDMFATFAAITVMDMPDTASGQKGGEDSFNIMDAIRGELLKDRPPIFFNDHKEADDPAVVAMRLDSPTVGGKVFVGKWKLFFNADLVRHGFATPTELYNLADDPKEANNRIADKDLRKLVKHLSTVATKHRTCGGHRLAEFAPQNNRIAYYWSQADSNDAARFSGRVFKQPTPKSAPKSAPESAPESFDDQIAITEEGVTMTLKAITPSKTKNAGFTYAGGVGISTGVAGKVDQGEAIEIQFDKDVIVESVSITAGGGTCGGFYRVGEGAPLAIYCTDADIDAKDQSGILSDIGVVKAGQVLRFDSAPHFGVEAPGAWTLDSLKIRLLK